MRVRGATVSDAQAILALVNEYAEQDRMLFRPLADIYENLQTFRVAEVNGSIVGCGALEVVWSDLAEIKSLAVAELHKGMGVGRALVEASVKQAKQLGVGRVFALTLDSGFFEKLGFERVDKSSLPMKVWSDCARCPKQNHCDETAVIKHLAREG